MPSINISLGRDKDNNETMKICSGESCEPKKKEVLDAEEARKAAAEAAAATLAVAALGTTLHVPFNDNGNNYYIKYMKYKLKYLALKSKIF